MTDSEAMKALEQIHGFIQCRTDMAMPGDAKTLLGSWCKAVEYAIERLKVTEPRVMTFVEAKALDWDFCYLEQERMPGKAYRAVCGKYALTCVTWPVFTGMRTAYGDEAYNKRWRCWTAKPTDEQREAVKWDD